MIKIHSLTVKFTNASLQLRFFSSTCHYKTLQVSTEASAEAIKASYLQLAKKYHPDILHERSLQHADRFKAIQEAYSVLSDPDKRLAYDSQNGKGLSV